MKEITLINFTILKNLLFQGNLSFSLIDCIKLFQSMNYVLKEGDLPKHEIDIKRLRQFAIKNFRHLDEKFIVDEDYLKKSNICFMDITSEYNEIFAFRAVTDSKFNDKIEVQSINERIKLQIKDKHLLKELATWRKNTLDIHSPNSDFYYLYKWDSKTKTRKKFHEYEL